MGFILNLLYATFMLFASPWLLWRAVVRGKGRRGWTQKLWGAIPRCASTSPCLWLHAVSVGEVNLLAPLLVQLKALRPELEFAISTTTETGFELAQKKHGEHFVFFCPHDFTWAIRSVVQRLRPTALVLVELELWPNLIRKVSDAGLPVVVVNGRLSESSFSNYRRFRPLLKPMLGRLSLVLAQTETYAQRFRELGVPASRVATSGNVKFDGVETRRLNQRTQTLCHQVGWSPAVLLSEFGSGGAMPCEHREARRAERIFLAGSTQLEEDLLAAKVYLRLAPDNTDLRLVLVPRQPQRCDALEQQLIAMGLRTMRRSQFNDVAEGQQEVGPQSEGDFNSAPVHQTGFASNEPASVLIVDVIGELGAWWGAAEVAYVGGSLGSRGGQNMLEPAAFGMPVAFGPNTANFREIVSQLLQVDAAVVVHDEDSLLAFVAQALQDPAWAKRIGAAAQQVVTQHGGAARRTAAAIVDLLESP